MPINKVPERPALTSPVDGRETAFLGQLYTLLQQYGYSINQLIARENEGSWKPALTFGGADTGIAYTAREGHFYRIGHLVYVSGWVDLSSKGTATGDVEVSGLPFSAADELTPGVEHLCSVPFVSGMSGLTSAPTAGIGSPDQILLYGWGGAGSARLTAAEFTDASQLVVNGVYLTDED